MSNQQKQTVKTFYEYIITPSRSTVTGKEWPLDSFAEAVKADVGFPRGFNNKDDIHSYLKDIDVPQSILNNFLYRWGSYSESDQAPIEIKKQTWIDTCEERKKRDTYLIEHYSHGIRGESDYYDQTFEEMEESKARRNKKYEDEHKAIYVDKTKPEYTNPIIEYDNFRSKKPEGMTSAEYIKKKRQLRGLAKQEHEEREQDLKIIMHTPRYIVGHKIDAINCGCKAENIRRGIYCKTCKLLLRVDKYIMELFKNEAEGRGLGSGFKVGV